MSGSETFGASNTHRSSAARGQCTASYDYVHRICGHAHEECCRRTADKALGLPPLRGVEAPHRPCPACTLGKMKAVPKGQNALSTGLTPTRAGQVLCGDTFGPIAIPGLAGERYFLVLVCQFSNWGVVRTCKTLTEVPNLVEEMIVEIQSMVDKRPDQVSMTLHTDNASVFKSGHHRERMTALGVQLHYSAPYEPRTNPYAERYGGVLMSMTRALLLEGSYPPSSGVSCSK